MKIKRNPWRKTKIKNKRKLHIEIKHSLDHFTFHSFQYFYLKEKAKA